MRIYVCGEFYECTEECIYAYECVSVCPSILAKIYLFCCRRDASGGSPVLAAEMCGHSHLQVGDGSDFLELTLVHH